MARDRAGAPVSSSRGRGTRPRMTDTGDQRKPNIGGTIPTELAPDEGAGGGVERAEAAPPGQHEDGESFSGEETIAEVAEELDDKRS